MLTDMIVKGMLVIIVCNDLPEIDHRREDDLRRQAQGLPVRRNRGQRGHSSSQTSTPPFREITEGREEEEEILLSIAPEEEEEADIAELPTPSDPCETLDSRFALSLSSVQRRENIDPRNVRAAGEFIEQLKQIVRKIEVWVGGVSDSRNTPQQNLMEPIYAYWNSIPYGDIDSMTECIDELNAKHSIGAQLYDRLALLTAPQELYLTPEQSAFAIQTVFLCGADLAESLEVLFTFCREKEVHIELLRRKQTIHYE